MGKDRPTTKQIAEAIARRAGNEELTRILVEELPGSELASLLLHVMRERSRSVTWADALRLVERNGLVRADTADARVLTELDARAFAAAEGFDAVELSPVAPFGVNALTGIDQNNVLTATRGTEVLADPTIAMALECASRRKREGRAGVVRLAASQRLIRMQPFDDPGFSRHFRLFALVTAGRDTGDERFEQESLREQLTVWLTLLGDLRTEGWEIPDVRIELSHTRVMRALLTSAGVPLETLRGHVSPMKFDEELKRRGLKLPGPTTEPLKVLDGELRRLGERMERLRTGVLEPLAARFPGTEGRFDFSRLHGVNYYEGPTVHVVLRHSDGRELPVGDGGFTTWTQSLLSDRKERLLTGALGTEFLYRVFRPTIPPSRCSPPL